MQAIYRHISTITGYYLFQDLRKEVQFAGPIVFQVRIIFAPEVGAGVKLA